MNPREYKRSELKRLGQQRELAERKVRVWGKNTKSNKNLLRGTQESSQFVWEGGGLSRRGGSRHVGQGVKRAQQKNSGLRSGEEKFSAYRDPKRGEWKRSRIAREGI